MDNNYCMDIDSDCTHIKAMREEIERLRADLAAAKAEIELRAQVAEAFDVTFEKEIAARDLVIKQMRVALDFYLEPHCNCDFCHAKDYDVTEYARDALALQPTTEALDAYVQRAVEQEREACALVSDELGTDDRDWVSNTTDKCAAAIRGRGK